ncbi:PA domain-containing protein [Massilia sp. PWRC2]|uniref:PA domain-containing protein n=1 Tax=Massilia sp. PWRC2 TaxID=2804626 RepID=UPI003CF5DCC3
MRSAEQLAVAVLAAALSVPLPAPAATITIINRNDPGVGFNDPTPATPVGGNGGTTLGQQRLIAFEYAASVWGAALASTVPLRVAASFVPLTCTATTATLGSAGAADIYADFPHAPRPATWYPAALASKLAGIDQSAADAPHIVARFNSRLGLFDDCMPNDGFYLGIDGQAGGRIDLVTVLLHELAHGLGFQTFTNDQNGKRANELPSVWDYYLVDNRSGKSWAQMSDAERSSSAISGAGLSWNGAGVTAAVPGLLLPLSQLTISGPNAGAAAGMLAVGDAAFGTPLSARAIAAELMPVVDSSDGTGMACTALDAANRLAVAGKVALVDRGSCAFVDKARQLQAAGAVAMVVADNAPGEVSELGGSDPAIVIAAVRISQQAGQAIKLALQQRTAQHSGVFASLGIDPTRLAGTDSVGRVRMYTPSQYAPGSTVSHFTTEARRNLLMEPSISADLTHTVTAPVDLTYELLKDIGW